MTPDAEPLLLVGLGGPPAPEVVAWIEQDPDVDPATVGGGVLRLPWAFDPGDGTTTQDVPLVITRRELDGSGLVGDDLQPAETIRSGDRPAPGLLHGGSFYLFTFD